MEKLLITPKEATEVLSIGRNRIYELVATGQIKAIRSGKAIKIPMTEVRRWIDSQVGRNNMGETTS